MAAGLSIWPRLPVSSTRFLVALSRAGRSGWSAAGGPLACPKSVFHSFSQGQSLGRWSRSRRAEDAIRAGTPMIRRRIDPQAARAWLPPQTTPAVWVRLNAMTARMSQAAFALKTPDGRCAKGPSLRSAWTCSMIACCGGSCPPRQCPECQDR